MVLRFDSQKGNEFFCRKDLTDPSAHEPSLVGRLWQQCVSELLKKTPGFKFEEPSREVLTDYEPIALSMLGMKGWEAYFARQGESRRGSDGSATTSTFYLKRQEI